MKKFIVANFKMNLLEKEYVSYFTTIKNEQSERCEMVFCVPFPYFYLKRKFMPKHINFGGQNISHSEKGAFTSQVSASMFKQFHIKYCIIGHSECRGFLHETDDIIAKKVKIAIDNGINVIMCIGESEGQKNENRTKEVLTEQLTSVLKNLNYKELNQVIIAYEPIWSIGTGNVATEPDIKLAVDAVQKTIISLFGKKEVDKIPLLYGGSVNENNCVQIMQVPGISGLLIGGASLDVDKYLKIVRSCENE